MQLTGFMIDRNGHAVLTIAGSDETFSVTRVAGGGERAPKDWTQADLLAAAASIVTGRGGTLDGSDITLAPLPIKRLTIVDRMSNAELDAALAFFNNGTAEGTRSRERWTAATEVNPANADTIRLFAALYGAERAAELLAPE